jgi:hypothetical protein
MNFTRSALRTAAIGLAFVATAAIASVTFDPATGTGFVGKGDVQNAFGWNNAAFQSSWTGISFNYTASVTYSATCFWTTGEGRNGQHEHYVVHTRSSNVSSVITYTGRSHHQVDGINLTGFGDYLDSGDAVPVVGNVCVGGPTGAGRNGVWIDVHVVPGSNTGGLYVAYNGGTPVLLGNF